MLMQTLPVLGLSHALASGGHVSSAPLWCYVLWICLVLAVASLDVWLCVGMIRSLRSRGDDEDDDGGGRRRGPDRPRLGPTEDPEWWPEFEREFAEYAACMGRTRRAPLVECAPDSNPRV